MKRLSLGALALFGLAILPASFLMAAKLPSPSSPERTSDEVVLAQGSILIDVPRTYGAAFADLTPIQRTQAVHTFTRALEEAVSERSGGAFRDWAQEALQVAIPVGAAGAHPESEAMAAAARTVLTAFNEAAEGKLSFELPGLADPPTCVRYFYDRETGQWIAVYNWGVTVSSGRVQGSSFNWLPVAEASGQSSFELPEELAFLQAGDGMVADLCYHVCLSFPIDLE